MAPMSLNLATEEGEENEHWSKKLWKLLNEGNTSIGKFQDMDTSDYSV